MKTIAFLSRAIIAFCLFFTCESLLADGPSLPNKRQAERCRAILESSLVDFYLPGCVDQEHGGYHQELDQNGAFRPGEKFLTLQARQLWFFSTIATANIRREASLDAAKKGYEFIQKHFRDAERGGYYSKVSREGQIVDNRKHAYLNAFVVYALVEYYRATQQPEVLQQAMELFKTLETRAHDAKHLGYEEFFTSDWKIVSDPKESGYVGAIGVKTYNTHLHLMEAFTSLYRETHDPLVGARLKELIEINTKTVKHPDYPCNIDAWHPDWTIVNTPQNLRASYGHDIECVWLVLDAVEALGQPVQSVREWAKSICNYSIEKGYDTKHHGFFYSGPLGKSADDRKKEWWPQCEALVAMLTMEKLTGESRFRQLFDETLDFVEKHQVAPKGSWWATLREDGSLGAQRSRTSMWQGAYHNGRAMLLCEQLLTRDATQADATPSHRAAAFETFKIWPAGKMPGTSRANPAEPEFVISDRRRPFYQISNVSEPTVAVFLAPESKRTGASVLVCPGGGMQRLAYEHEGLEIADWLNPIGITVFVLKYRVPGPSSTALMDVQRAMGLIRQRADLYQTDPDRISVMGFSAGGEVALLLATHFKERSYEPIDEADKITCRPTNACLLYTGGIKRGNELRPDIASKLDAKSTPSMFIAHAFGDDSINSLALAWQLKVAGIPCDVHIYKEGGHGFGARSSGLPLNGWKASYLQFLEAQGFMDKPFLGPYADKLATLLPTNEPIKRLSTDHQNLSIADGYAVQRRLVRQQLEGARPAGFKAAYTNAAAQKKFALEKPLFGVLYRSGRIDSAATNTIELGKSGSTMIETEIGYVVSNGLDISTHIESVAHIQGAFEAVVPVIELPANLRARMDGELTPVDSLAANIGSSRFLVGKSGGSPDNIDPNRIAIKLQKDGKTLHETSGNIVVGGQWKNLISIVNEIVDQGYTLHAGDLVICGALGEIHVADKGHYHVDYGSLGIVEFEMK